MKITRRQLRKLISKALLESRKVKQKFYSQVRSQYPDIDNAYWVTWWGDGVWNWQDDELVSPVWESTEQHLTELLAQVERNPTFDIPCNLVDPTGNITAPHGESWGLVGIVFKGIPTAGFSQDVGSHYQDSRTDRQRWRVGTPEFDQYNAQDDLFSFERLNQNEDGSREWVKEKVFDPNIPNPFTSHQPNFNYSWNEFAVVPKEIVGVVYHNDLSLFHLDEGEWPTLMLAGIDPELAGQKMKEMGVRLGLPVAVGQSEISEFYRSLYRE